MWWLVVIWAIVAVIMFALLAHDIIYDKSWCAHKDEWTFARNCALAWPVTLPMLIFYWMFGQDN